MLKIHNMKKEKFYMSDLFDITIKPYKFTERTCIEHGCFSYLKCHFEKKINVYHSFLLKIWKLVNHIHYGSRILLKSRITT